MDKINFKVRFNNPLFILQFLAMIFLPVLAYFGFKWEDLTTWGAVLHLIVMAVQNPFVVFSMLVGILTAITDPTTKGLFDSEQARAYIKPR